MTTPTVVPYNTTQQSIGLVPPPTVLDLKRNLLETARRVREYNPQTLNEFIQQLSFAEKTAVLALLELSKQKPTSGGRKTCVSRKKN